MIQGAERRIGFWRLTLLAIACVVALLPGIATLPPIDRDEARFVQATKQMLASGDFVDIRFQDEHRYKKPVGIYWLQSAAVLLSGGDADSAIARYRLVSIAAAVVAVLLLASLGAHMFGATVGLAAGVMLIGIFGLGFEGRIAKTDATLLAVTLLAQLALARLYLGAREGRENGRSWWWVFWLAIGAGLLVKGPITLLVSGLTVAGIVLADRDRRWIRQLRPVAGIGIALLVAAPWFVAITAKTGLAFWTESVGKDMFGKVVSGQELHGAPPGYYVLVYSLYLWPFGLLAFNGFLKALDRWREPRLLFCLAWYVPFWIVLELAPTKLPHYLLPAYPALLLLAAWTIFSPGRQDAPLVGWRKWLSRLSALGLLAVTLAFAAIPVASVVYFGGDAEWWSVAATTLALGAGYLASGHGPPALSLLRIATATAAAAAFVAVLAWKILPSIKPMWLSPAIVTAFDAAKPCPDSVLATVGYHEPSLVFLAGTETRLVDVAAAARHLAENAHCNLAVLPAEELEALGAALPQGSRIVEAARISGINYSNGRGLDLRLVRLAE